MLLSISFSISSSLCPSLHAPNNFFPIWIHQMWDKLLILEVEKEGGPLSSKWWALFREYKITRYERWVSMLSGHLPFSKWVKSVLDEQRIMCPPLQAGYCTQEGVGPQKSCVLPSSTREGPGHLPAGPQRPLDGILLAQAVPSHGRGTLPTWSMVMFLVEMAKLLTRSQRPTAEAAGTHGCF